MAGSQILGPDGRPFSRNGDASRLKETGFALKQISTFSGIVGSVSKAYRWAFDEALRNSPENARAMRRDATVMALLRERQMPTAQSKWHLEPEDPKDPHQVDIANRLQELVQAIPRFTRFRLQLLEAIWFGRYGNQLAIGKRVVNGHTAYAIYNHQPIHGDKFIFRWDGTPGVLISQLYSQRYQDYGLVGVTDPYVQKLKSQGGVVLPTDRGLALFLETPQWRERFVVHMHESEDADFQEPELAGGIYGVGLRHRVYWLWWLRNEVLSSLLDYLQRVGAGGLTLIGFEANNYASEQAALHIGEQMEAGNVILVPKPVGTEQLTSTVDRIEPSSAGSETLMKVVNEFFDNWMERLFVGQVMSGGADKGDGLGGTGRANFAEATKDQLIQMDSDALDECITEQVVQPLKRWNFPMEKFKVFFKTDLSKPDPGGLLEAAKTIVDMGGEVVEQELLEIAGLSVPEPGDKTLGGKQQMMAQQGLGAQGPEEGGGQESGEDPESKQMFDSAMDSGDLFTHEGLGKMKSQLADQDMLKKYARPFDEKLHPRDKGKFASKPGQGASPKARNTAYGGAAGHPPGPSPLNKPGVTPFSPGEGQRIGSRMAAGAPGADKQAKQYLSGQGVPTAKLEPPRNAAHAVHNIKQMASGGAFVEPQNLRELVDFLIGLPKMVLESIKTQVGQIKKVGEDLGVNRKASQAAEFLRDAVRNKTAFSKQGLQDLKAQMRTVTGFAGLPEAEKAKRMAQHDAYMQQVNADAPPPPGSAAEKFRIKQAYDNYKKNYERGFDESKVKRDHGKFATKQGASGLGSAFAKAFGAIQNHPARQQQQYYEDPGTDTEGIDFVDPERATVKKFLAVVKHWAARTATEVWDAIEEAEHAKHHETRKHLASHASHLDQIRREFDILKTQFEEFINSSALKYSRGHYLPREWANRANALIEEVSRSRKYARKVNGPFNFDLSPMDSVEKKNGPLKYDAMFESDHPRHPDGKFKEKGEVDQVKIEQLKLGFSGYSASSLLKFMGKNGWTFAAAKAAMLLLGKQATDLTIKTQLYAGKVNSKHYAGKPADLTPEQKDALAYVTGDKLVTPPSVVEEPFAQIGQPSVHFGDLEKISDLGGSTGAALYKDSIGDKYVVKSPSPKGGLPHLQNEVDADLIYKAAGVSDLVESRLSKEHKISYYLGEGKTLGQLDKKSDEYKNAVKRLQAGFALDALLANWDVIGQGMDNVLVKDGLAFRIDNGGSMAFRAQGGQKGSAWGYTVGELSSMRNKSTNPSAAAVFGSLTDQQVAAQINALDFQAIYDAAPSEQREKLKKRYEYMQGWASSASQSSGGGSPKIHKAKAPKATPQTFVYTTKNGKTEHTQFAAVFFKSKGPKLNKHSDGQPLINMQAPAWTRAAYANMSEGAARAIRKYTDGDYTKINNYLWKKATPDKPQPGHWGHIGEHMKDAICLLKAFRNLKPSAERFTVYRRGRSGGEGDDAFIKKFEDALANGENSELNMVKLRGITSAATTPSNAESDIGFVISANKAIDAVPLSSYKGAESEVLLPHNARYRVLKVERNVGYGGNHNKIYLEQL